MGDWRLQVQRDPRGFQGRDCVALSPVDLYRQPSLDCMGGCLALDRCSRRDIFAAVCGSNTVEQSNLGCAATLEVGSCKACRVSCPQRTSLIQASLCSQRCVFQLGTTTSHVCGMQQASLCIMLTSLLTAWTKQLLLIATVVIQASYRGAVLSDNAAGQDECDRGCCQSLLSSCFTLQHHCHKKWCTSSAHDTCRNGNTADEVLHR